MWSNNTALVHGSTTSNTPLGQWCLNWPMPIPTGWESCQWGSECTRTPCRNQSWEREGHPINESVKVSVSRSCLSLWDPMDYSSPTPLSMDFQARILERVAISFSWGSSQPRDRTHVSCIGRWVLYCWASREARQRGVTLAKHDIQHTHFVRLSLNCQKVKSMWRGESRKFYLEDIVNGLYLILWPGLHCFRWALTSSGLRSSPFTLGTA